MKVSKAMADFDELLVLEYNMRCKRFRRRYLIDVIDENKKAISMMKKRKENTYLLIGVFSNIDEVDDYQVLFRRHFIDKPRSHMIGSMTYDKLLDFLGR